MKTDNQVIADLQAHLADKYPDLFDEEKQFAEKIWVEAYHRGREEGIRRPDVPMHWLKGH